MTCHVTHTCTQEEIASRAEKFIAKKNSLQGELKTVHVCVCIYVQYNPALTIKVDIQSCVINDCITSGDFHVGKDCE